MVNKKINLDLIIKDLNSYSSQDLQILYKYYNVHTISELISKIYKKGNLPSIFNAIDEKDNDLAKKIIRYTPRFNINVRNQERDTALIVAIKSGNNEMAKYLIDKGANLDLQNQFGDSALILAARTENDEMVKYLINAGANPDLQNSIDDTALFWALVHTDDEMAEYLIDPPGRKGAKINEYLNLINDNSRLLSYLITKNIEIPKEIRNEIPNYIKLKVQDLKKQIKMLRNELDSDEQELIYGTSSCTSDDIEELEKCIEMEEEMIKYKPGGEKEKELIEKYKEHPYFSAKQKTTRF